MPTLPVFSAWIDADGRIIARGPRRATGTLLAEVSRDDRASWYLRHGDWFAGTCLVVCLACAVSAFCPRRRSPAPDGRPSKRDGAGR